jgi:hypothetical protein
MIPPAALHVVDLSHVEMKKPSAIPLHYSSAMCA